MTHIREYESHPTCTLSRNREQWRKNRTSPPGSQNAARRGPIFRPEASNFHKSPRRPNRANPHVEFSAENPRKNGRWPRKSEHLPWGCGERPGASATVAGRGPRHWPPPPRRSANERAHRPRGRGLATPTPPAEPSRAPTPPPASPPPGWLEIRAELRSFRCVISSLIFFQFSTLAVGKKSCEAGKISYAGLVMGLLFLFFGC